MGYEKFLGVPPTFYAEGRGRVLRSKSSPESAYASRVEGFPLRPLTQAVPITAQSSA